MVLSKKTKKAIIELTSKVKMNNQTKILKKLSDIILHDNPCNKTITVRYSLAKNIFKQQHIDDQELLSKMKPAANITTSVRDNDLNVRNKKKKISISRKIIKKILSFNMSDNIHEITFYILLVTGCRTGELCTSSFTNSSSKKKIKIDIIKKRRDKKQNFTILTLANKYIVLKNIKKFKSMYKKISENQTQGSFMRRLSEQFKKKIHPLYSSHLLRNIYANYLYTFRNTSNLTINPFIQKILNHQTTHASIPYTRIKFSFKKDFILS